MARLLCLVLPSLLLQSHHPLGVGSCGPPGFYGTISASIVSQAVIAVINSFALQMPVPLWSSSAK